MKVYFSWTADCGKAQYFMRNCFAQYTKAGPLRHNRGWYLRALISGLNQRFKSPHARPISQRQDSAVAASVGGVSPTRCPSTPGTLRFPFRPVRVRCAWRSGTDFVAFVTQAKILLSCGLRSSAGCCSGADTFPCFVSDFPVL